MIVEERIYRIRTGGMGTYLKLVREEGLAIQQPILGRLIGYFTTEVCDSAFTYARRCRIATRGLLKSIQRKRRDDDDPPPARTRRPRR